MFGAGVPAGSSPWTGDQVVSPLQLRHTSSLKQSLTEPLPCPITSHWSSKDRPSRKQHMIRLSGLTLDANTLEQGMEVTLKVRTSIESGCNNEANFLSLSAASGLCTAWEVSVATVDEPASSQAYLHARLPVLCFSVSYKGARAPWHAQGCQTWDLALWLVCALEMASFLEKR